MSSCFDVNCSNLSIALCFHCEKSLCLTHIIRHQENLIDCQAKFYEQLEKLYFQLYSMSVDECFRQVVEQISTENRRTIDLIFHLRTIREELVERLNRFKTKQFEFLKEISRNLSSTERIFDEQRAKQIDSQLKDVQTSIQSLVYGIQIEISETIQLRKIFYQKKQI